MIEELTFFTKLDHPYCNYLLGAKTTLDNGGILVGHRHIDICLSCCLSAYLYNSIATLSLSLSRQLQQHEWHGCRH